MALLVIIYVIVPASDKLSINVQRKRAFTKRLGLQSMFHMVIHRRGKFGRDQTRNTKGYRLLYSGESAHLDPPADVNFNKISFQRRILSLWRLRNSKKLARRMPQTLSILQTPKIPKVRKNRSRLDRFR